MNSRSFVLSVLFLLVCSVFADEASQHKTEVTQPETKVNEPKQTNQGGGGGGGGYCRNRYCCGGWSRGGCNRYCCRSENEVETVEEPKQTNQGGGGGCRRQYCCGGYGRNGCNRYCCADNADNIGTASGGGGRRGGGTGAVCHEHGCCSASGYWNKGGGCDKCCQSAEEAKAFMENQAKGETNN